MPRLMSVALTEQAVVERRKTVTRRLGWLHAEVGMPLTLCRKVMGRKKGEPLVRVAEVQLVAVDQQPLHVDNTGWDAQLEGFPDWTWPRFVEFFCGEMGVEPHQVVTRLEWRYLTDPCPECDNQFEGSVPGWQYGSAWDWVPCPTCRGVGWLPRYGPPTEHADRLMPWRTSR